MWNLTSITTFFNNLHVKRWANWTLSEYQWNKEFWGFTHLLGYFLFLHVVKCKGEKKKFLTIMATSNFHIGSNLVFHSIPTFWWWWVEKKSKRSFRIAQWGQNMFESCTGYFLSFYTYSKKAKKLSKYDPLRIWHRRILV